MPNTGQMTSSATDRHRRRRGRLGHMCPSSCMPACSREGMSRGLHLSAQRLDAKRSNRLSSTSDWGRHIRKRSRRHRKCPSSCSRRAHREGKPAREPRPEFRDTRCTSLPPKSFLGCRKCNFSRRLRTCPSNRNTDGPLGCRAGPVVGAGRCAKRSTAPPTCGVSDRRTRTPFRTGCKTPCDCSRGGSRGRKPFALGESDLGYPGVASRTRLGTRRTSVRFPHE